MQAMMIDWRHSDAMHRSHACFVPSSPFAACQNMYAASAILIIQAGVITSVSLFAFVHVVFPIVSVVVLLSLLVICLTGRSGLTSPVGQEREAAAKICMGRVGA